MLAYEADGLDVALVDHDASNTRADGRMACCDVLITVHEGSGALVCERVQ